MRSEVTKERRRRHTSIDDRIVAYVAFGPAQGRTLDDLLEDIFPGVHEKANPTWTCAVWYLRHRVIVLGQQGRLVRKEGPSPGDASRYVSSPRSGPSPSLKGGTHVRVD